MYLKTLLSMIEQKFKLVAYHLWPFRDVKADLKPSLLELNFKPCNNCDGTGLVRSIESQSLQLIRNLDLILKSTQRKEIKLELNPELSEYMLNNKYIFI